MSTNNVMNGDLPIIVACVANLYFSTRIESAAHQSGFRITWLDQTSLKEAGVNPSRVPDSSEQPFQGDSLLLDHMTRIHPALIIIDLNHEELPWYRWIGLLKSSPATRRIPVLCFGSHMDRSSLRRARAIGADVVLAREKFVQSLPKLILETARIIDLEAISASCEQPFSEIGVEGVAEFNQGSYFEAHELLENAWNLDSSPGRDLYRAILQVAVAYYQIERGNYQGAIKMFLRLRQWIDPLPDLCRGVDVAQLRKDVDRVYSALVSLGETRISEFDRNLFKPVVLIT